MITVVLNNDEGRALLELLGDQKGEVLERIYGKVVEATFEAEGRVE